MDFDDLDEAAPVVENMQPLTGTVLEWMPRSHRLPGLAENMHQLPGVLQKQLAPEVLEAYQSKRPRPPTAKVRLLCVHGVADTYKQEWFALEGEAPAEIEVAVHEFPGHGFREKEPIFKSFEELVDDAFEALRVPMETGNFALLGHSIGCLVIIEVAKRAEAELNVKPVAVFMVERGAAQWPLFTDTGLKALQDRDFDIDLDLAGAEDRSLDLKEKELEGSVDDVLFFSSVTEGLTKEWNDRHSDEGECISKFDEIISVNGVEGSAGQKHAEIKRVLEGSENNPRLQLHLRRRAYDMVCLHQPGVAGMLQNGPTRALDRWVNVWYIENKTREVGDYAFTCPLIALSAQASVDASVPIKELHPIHKRIVKWGCKVYNKEIGDGKVFTGHFPSSTFEDWVAWTENKKAFRVIECPDCDHMTIKSNKRFKDTVYGTLSDLVKLWSS